MIRGELKEESISEFHAEKAVCENKERAVVLGDVWGITVGTHLRIPCSAGRMGKEDIAIPGEFGQQIHLDLKDSGSQWDGNSRYRSTYTHLLSVGEVLTPSSLK
jgi:hypothetical protein